MLLGRHFFDAGDHEFFDDRVSPSCGFFGGQRAPTSIMPPNLTNTASALLLSSKAGSFAARCRPESSVAA